MLETIGRLTARIGSGLSRFWNVVRFGGRWHTTTSARCYREAWLSDDPKWRRRMNLIDLFFRKIKPLTDFLGMPNVDPHCEWAAGNKTTDSHKWLADMEKIEELRAYRK